MATLWCDVSCQNNHDQHVNILNGNFNLKNVGKTYNKPNKLISVQFNTNTCNNNNNNNNNNTNNNLYLMSVTWHLVRI